MRFEDRGDRPRIAGHLQRHPVARVEALREQLHLIGPRLDPARRPQPAAIDDGDLAEVAVNIQRHCSHSLPPCSATREKRWANDIDGSALAAQPGKSQGRPLRNLGLEAHRPKRPAQPAFSQRPLSQSAEPKPATGQQRSLQRAVSCPEERSCASWRERSLSRALLRVKPALGPSDRGAAQAPALAAARSLWRAPKNEASEAARVATTVTAHSWRT